VETVLCRISGFVGKPEAARKKGGHDYFFVNGRYMRHPYFHRAVVGAYERLVPESMLPPYFIYFDVSPTDIDVNIHPTKTEIKFENEQGIFQVLSAAVKDALGRFCDIPTIDFNSEGRPDIPVFDPQRDAIRTPQVHYNPTYNPFGKSSVPSSSPVGIPPSIPSAPIDLPDGEHGLFDDVASSTLPAIEMSPIHYQYKGRFIMTAVKSGLMIIDQHRADVRICYERNMERLAQRQGSTQRLLFPEMIQFSPSEDVLMQRFLPDLSSIGFDISSLGGGSYAIAGVPVGIDAVDPLSLLRNMVTDGVEKGVGNNGEQHASLALSMARNTAIAYGQVLTNEEMERVVNELFACSNANYTPDGYPILSILPQQDIERFFV